MSFDTSTILRFLADDSCLKILNHIAKSYEAGQVDGTSIPITITSLTRRQYYRRLSILTKMGLIVRNNSSKYTITLFGRLINEQIVSIEKIVKHYWKIQGIDSIKEATAKDVNSEHQFIGLVNNLIEDHHLKQLLFSLYSLRREQGDTITAKNGY